MNITVGARCWDGERRKSLQGNVQGDRDLKDIEIIILEELPVQMKKRMRFDPKLGALLGSFIPLFLVGGYKRASAMISEPVAVPVMATATKTKILHAFDPLIQLIQSLSYPIAGVMIAGGCLFIMVGNREKGMQMLQNAAIGYILVQLSPMILELLVGIGGSI